MVNSFFKQYEGGAEIIIVNDGSTDKTLHIGKEFETQNPSSSFLSFSQNKGKGFAIARGVEKAQGDWILIIDADSATPIEEFEKLERKKNPNTVLIGSRYQPTKNAIRKQPKGRFLLGRIANALIRLLVLPGISDTQCGFKLFPAKAAKEIFARQQITRFAFDVESLLLAKNLGYEICEIPVSWFHQDESRIRPIRDACKTLWDLFRILSNEKRGAYQMTKNLPQAQA